VIGVGISLVSKRLAFSLNGGPGAPSVARGELRAGDGAVPASVRDDILLLVTELVTNAVRHAGVGPNECLHVEVTHRRAQVRVEVAHPGSEFERMPPAPSHDRTGGWGLVLLDRIADRWGIEHRGRDTGVWFELQTGDSTPFGPV
jgi:two-component sensor histidine kinase